MPRVCSNTCRGAERRRYCRGSSRRSVFEYTLRIRYNASDEMKPLSLSLFICLDKLRSLPRVLSVLPKQTTDRHPSPALLSLFTKRRRGMFAIWVAIFARLECNSAVRGNYFRDGSLDRWDIHRFRHFHPMKGYLRKNIRFIFVLNWEIRNQRNLDTRY